MYQTLNFHVGCSRTFKTYAAFSCHIYRDHRDVQKRKKLHSYRSSDDVLKCSVLSCNARFEDLIELCSHLKIHIDEGLSVACPFKRCGKSFHVRSSFSSHVSRKHKDWSERLLSEAVLDFSMTESGNIDGSAVAGESSTLHASADIDDCDDVNSTVSSGYLTESSNYLNSLALFYLKLQAKLLLPESTIQSIKEEFQEIHEIGRNHRDTFYVSLWSKPPVCKFEK